MIKLYLVRHGETQYNLENRIQGQGNSALTALGVRQAQAVAQSLASEEFSAVYSSDLGRAKETAEIVAAPHSLAVNTTDKLREAAFGVVQGLTRDEIEERFPAELNDWRNHPKTMRPPGAETYDEVAHRCGEFLAELQEVHPDGDTVLVVAHGGSLRGLIIAACALPTAFYRMLHFSNASISILDIGESPSLRQLNDTCHLAGVEVTDVDADNAN